MFCKVLIHYISYTIYYIVYTIFSMPHQDPCFYVVFWAPRFRDLESIASMAASLERHGSNPLFPNHQGEKTNQTFQKDHIRKRKRRREKFSHWLRTYTIL